MRKRNLRPLVALTGMILASLLASPAKTEAQAGETGNHHLLWDNTDMLWRCVGSPPGCTSGAS